MKKILFLYLLLFSFFISANYSRQINDRSENSLARDTLWGLFGVNDTTRWYYDKESVEYDSSHNCTVWAKIEYKIAQYDEAEKKYVTHFLIHYQIFCSSGKIKYIEMIFYYTDGSNIVLKTTSQPVKVPDDSLFKELLNDLCK